jgi:hypothetical protein
MGQDDPVGWQESSDCLTLARLVEEVALLICPSVSPAEILSSRRAKNKSLPLFVKL